MPRVITERKHALRGDFADKLFTIAATMEYNSKRNIPFDPQELIAQEYPNLRRTAKRITEYFTRAGHLANGGGHGKNRDMQYFWIGPSVTHELIQQMASIKDAVELEYQQQYEARKVLRTDPATTPPATPIEAAIQKGIIATHHPEPPAAAIPQSQRYTYLVGELQKLQKAQEATLAELASMRQSHYRLLDALTDISKIYDGYNTTIEQIHQTVTQLNDALK